jgi:hypothetical protein
LAGLDWPSQAHPQIGMRRLSNLQDLVTKVLVTGTPGDLIETGVWRGGSTILMRGILKAHGITDRAVWVADSFEGFPMTAEQGASPQSFTTPELAAVRGYFQGAREASEPAFHTSLDHMMQGASLEEVRDRFDRYGLLDDQVNFLQGWFRDTLPSAPIERLAVLRLDGDLYDSTYDALDALYPRLSVGGYIIVDDYGWVEECRTAVHDYLTRTASRSPSSASTTKRCTGRSKLDETARRGAARRYWFGREPAVARLDIRTAPLRLADRGLVSRCAHDDYEGPVSRCV